MLSPTFQASFFTDNRPRWKCEEPSRLTLNTFSLDDVDGDGKRRQNGEAYCQRNASLHSNIEPFMWIDTLHSTKTTHFNPFVPLAPDTKICSHHLVSLPRVITCLLYTSDAADE